MNLQESLGSFKKHLSFQHSVIKVGAIFLKEGRKGVRGALGCAINPIVGEGEGGDSVVGIVVTVVGVEIGVGVGVGVDGTGVVGVRE